MSRYSPTARDMHCVLDMSFGLDMCLAQENVGEYHIETDRKGGYIEFAAGQIYRAKHIDKAVFAIAGVSVSTTRSSLHKKGLGNSKSFFIGENEGLPFNLPAV